MGQPVSAGSAYGLRPTLAWPVTWPAPLKSRYVTWGALQVLYAFVFALFRAKKKQAPESSFSDVRVGDRVRETVPGGRALYS